MNEPLSYHKEMENKDIDTINELCVTLPKYIGKYLRSIQYTTTSKTRLEYTKDILHFFEYIFSCYSEKPLKTLKDIDFEVLNWLDKDFFEDYFDYVKKYEKDGKIYSNAKPSVKRKLSALRNLFNYLYNNELIQSNHITKIKIPKLDEKEIVHLDSDETQDFLDVIEYGTSLTKKELEYHDKLKERDTAIAYLMLSTGIRVSECVGLNMNDVDFKKFRIRVIRKGGDEAYVYFSDEAAEHLLEYYEKRKRMHPLEEHKDALFLSSRRKRISVRSVETLVKKYAEKSVPLKKITPHSLRRTYGTALYEATSDIYLVAENLGHRDINTTKKHYSNISNAHKSDSRNKISLRG